MKYEQHKLGGFKIGDIRKIEVSSVSSGHDAGCRMVMINGS